MKNKINNFDDYCNAKVLILNLILQKKFEEAFELSKRWGMTGYYRFGRGRYNKLKIRPLRKKKLEETKKYEKELRRKLK